MQKVTMSEALEVFKENVPNIERACMENMSSIVRENQPAKTLDVDACTTVGDIKAAVNKLVIQRKTEGYRRTLNAIRRLKDLSKKQSNTITDTMIEYARNRDMREVAESYGMTFRGKMTKCLWHEDSTASVSLHKNKLHCFGCGVTHDTISLVMNQDGVAFPQAVKALQ